MRRSICITEPSYCFAGDEQTFKFIFTPASNLPKGAKLRFDLGSKGKEMEWEIPSTNLKDKRNLIWAILPDDKTLSAKLIEKKGQVSSVFEFALPSELKAGENFTIYLGSPSLEKSKGSMVQTAIQRKRAFHLSIDPRGKGDFKEHETFQIDVRGNTLKNIRITAPSIVRKNKHFDVAIRFEDQYGNLTSNYTHGVHFRLTHENFRDNLVWDLFVPDTGLRHIPTHHFPEPGVYQFKLVNQLTKEEFFSHPIRCLADSDTGLYWGQLHGETGKFDTLEQVESALRQTRDEKAWQFFGMSGFESIEETPSDIWKSQCQHTAEVNEDQRFNTFMGLQYLGEVPEEGLRHIVFAKEPKQMPRKKDSKTNSLSKLYKAFSPKEILSIPSFTMAKGFQNDFSQFDPHFERVVEIYNAWGSSECTAKEGNLRPIRSSGKTGVQETAEGSIIKALRRNRRFGFIAGGWDDRGIYQDLAERGQVKYSPGLTGIFATEQSKDALYQALHNRYCYATTGERMILDMKVTGTRMGGEVTTQQKPALLFTRYLEMFVAGTAPLKEVTLMRNGVPLKSFQPKGFSFNEEYYDEEPLVKTLLSPPDEGAPFAFYYLRVVQEDGHIGWTSPTWIDYTEEAALPKKAKASSKKPPT